MGLTSIQNSFQGFQNALLISTTYLSLRTKWWYVLNPFPASVASHIETRHLICTQIKWLVSIWNATLTWNWLCLLLVSLIASGTPKCVRLKRLNLNEPFYASGLFLYPLVYFYTNTGLKLVKQTELRLFHLFINSAWKYFRASCFNWSPDSSQHSSQIFMRNNLILPGFFILWSKMHLQNYGKSSHLPQFQSFLVKATK